MPDPEAASGPDEEASASREPDSASRAPESATAARILRAADELFSERGFDGVSVRDVAARAGANKALVFYYYHSKESLFDLVIGRYYAAQAEAFKKAFSEEGTSRERLHRLVGAFVDFVDAHQLYPRVVQSEIARGGANLERIQRHLTPLFEWTTRALSDVAPAAGPLAAKQLFVSVAGMVIHYYTHAPAYVPNWGDDPMSEQARAERRRHVHWAVDAFLDGLLKAKNESQ